MAYVPDIKRNASEQEVFDFVVKNLFNQGKPSIKDGICLYRDGDLKCAAGFLISDRQYRKGFETELVAGLISEGLKSKLIKRNVSIISSLQDVHDLWDQEGDLRFVATLNEIAAEYKLNNSILETTPLNGVRYKYLGDGICVGQ